MDKYFKIAGDLNTEKSDDFVGEIIDNNSNNIQLYLKSICSGKYYNQENERGIIVSEGNIIISFQQLQEMLDNGDYNIISATYFNDDMIEIKYQQFEKNISRHL